MNAKPKPFATEVDLCKAFLAALPEAWTPYPETAGFDLLLVRKADGIQVGVEAKLKLNVNVVSQALEEGGYWYSERENPDYRAVLVPWSDAGGFDLIAGYIGLTIIRMDSMRAGRMRLTFHPMLPGDNRHADDREWHAWPTAKRCRLPEYVPDVAAGASAPVQLTDWKIAALRIEATIELRGYATRADFAAHRIDARRWMARDVGWLTNDNGRLIKGPRFPNFNAQHPRVYAEIKADAEKWLVKLPLLADLPKQAVLT